MDNREFPTIGVETMNAKLYEAAIEDDMELLKSILEVECPPDLTLCLSPKKNTVLHIAVEFGHQNIVGKVIQLCPSLISQYNSKGDTPLHVAAGAGRLHLTKLLTPILNLTEGNLALEEGNPVWQAGGVALRMRNFEGSNPIHEALKKSHGKVALHLLAFEEGNHELAHDVNIAGESVLYLAAEAGLVSVVQKIIDSGDYSTGGPNGQNALHIAVIKGRLGVVEILLEKASNLIAQVDGFGNTVLHYASAESYCRVIEESYCRVFEEDEDRPSSLEDDQIQILELLLKANPSLAYVPDRNGDYPLFIAIRNGFGGAVETIIDHCPQSAELVNQIGQNALHLAVLEKTYWLAGRLRFDKKLINEPDRDGNTPMHLATMTNLPYIVRHLILCGPPDLTITNKEGLTAMDICGYTETKHPIRDILRKCGAVPGRLKWQERFPLPALCQMKELSPEFKKYGLQTLPIVTSLVATVTFAAALTVPGGYKNDGPREGLPVFMRKAALQAFVLSDILAFCSSMTATVLLIYANSRSEDAFKIYWALQRCYSISMVAILATITAFVTAVYVLTSKESLWLAVTSLLLGFGVPLFLAFYRWGLENLETYMFPEGPPINWIKVHKRCK